MPTPLNVILVHGTWADGLFHAVGDRLRSVLRLRDRRRPASGETYWYQDGHRFGCWLRAALEARGVDVRMHPPLLWSGANSFSARCKAGDDLAARMVSIDGRSLVIGHSHGGSVALQAVSALGLERASQVDVVTMNTPFVRALPCVSPSQTRAFSVIGLLAFLSHSLDQAQAAGVGVHDLLSLDRFTSAQLGLFTVGTLVVPGVALLIAQWFDDRVVSRQVTRFAGRRLHCIRGVSDEAGLAISGGLVASGVGRLLYGLVGRLARHPWMAGASLFLAMALLSAAFGVWSAPSLLSISSRILEAAIVCVVGLWLFASLGNALLGAEFAAVGLLYIGSLDSTPDAPEGTIRVDTFAVAQGTADGLRHSAVYEREDVVQLIAAGVDGDSAPGGAAANHGQSHHR